MKLSNFVLTLIVLLFTTTIITAENPIIHGYADPHMKIWNGKMYLLIGKDKSPELKDFTMPYWSIYSSTDLVNWTKETDIKPEDTYLGAGFEYCWAGDISTRNGKYYTYFSNHGFETGVVVANKPNGPYVDVLKKPLLPKEMSTNFEYDATVFIDSDGQQYIIFGRDGLLGKQKLNLHYQIAKLSDDMISLAEKPHDLINSKVGGFGSVLINKVKNDTNFIAQDHQYFHKYNGLYYLSVGMNYETSTNVYGPFSNRRRTSKSDGHSRFCEYNGQWYHCWEYTCEPYGNRMYRQVMMTYLHYKDNGDMLDDVNFMQKGKNYKYGVGNYNAAWDTIQAEWYFKKSQGMKKCECLNGGFEIQNIKNGDYLNFPNMKNLSANATINFRISSENAKGCTIEIRKDSEKGLILGTCKVPSTGSWKTYQTVSSKLKNEAGTANLYFVFKGKNDELIHLDWFKFSSIKL